MKNKELEKQNFVLWYGLYATAKDLDTVRANNREVLGRLLREYAEEVDKIEKSRRFCERIAHVKGMQTQGFDVTLEIGSFSVTTQGDRLKAEGF